MYRGAWYIAGVFKLFEESFWAPEGSFWPLLVSLWSPLDPQLDTQKGPKGFKNETNQNTEPQRSHGLKEGFYIPPRPL